TRGPVECFAFRHQLLSFGAIDFSRIGEFGGDLFVAIKFGDVCFIADDNEELLPALFTPLWGGETSDARGGLLQLAVIAIHVLCVRELVRGPDDVAQHLVGGRHLIGGRHVIDKLSQKVLFSRVFLYLSRVGIVYLRGGGCFFFGFLLGQTGGGHFPPARAAAAKT